jgi:Zn-dependent oligopeptidase
LTIEKTGIPTLRASDVTPGVDDAVARGNAVIEEALALPSSASFDEVFGRIDHAGRIAAQAYGRYAVPSQVHPDEAVRDAATEEFSGYDAATYGFLWDQALRDEIFAAFGSELLSSEVGARYRAEVLSAPWTEHPLDGLARFLGRPWSSRAFLERIEG